MKGFLLTYELYSDKFQNVWMWEEFPFRTDFGGKDIGIDLVAKTFTGEYWSVQCKCYAENATVDKGEVDSFLSASNMEFLDKNGKTARFAQLLWISTTNHWGSTANNVLKNYEKQFTRLNLTCLREANVDWNALDEGIFGSLAKGKISREPRPHQKDAIEPYYR